ncbi:MAG TPA: hypothetical protein VD788_16135 [Candidatus Polarisedimenticolaceae bacterium]|nr:hypothetical protein [Candidatus Polarisedimenticolaceae bacterium]
MRAPRAIVFCWVLLLSPFVHAQLKVVETEHLRLVYFDPVQAPLAPYVAQSFENSMEFQRDLFDYEPSEKVTVFLSDIADYGNAGATAVPRNFVAVQVAPNSFAYETYPSNERINTLMNHELVHVAAFDRPAGSDRTFRKLFRGKVYETADHPESILYRYLTAPRMAAPRWYHEGLAVFVETWMAGGLGRAQGSYDEMVFRSKVRDGSRFYDPLGLVAEGTKIDFQLEANSYLYGTRFITYLAYRYSPEVVLQWVTRAPGTRKYYAAQFERVFCRKIEEVWQEWIEWERRFQQANLDTIREYPVTPHRDLSGRALGSVSRGFVDPATGDLLLAFNYPGVVGHVGAIDTETGEVERLREVKGPMIYSVTSLAHDPEGRRLFYTADNTAFRDLYVLELPDGKKKARKRRLMRDLRVGELVFNRADRSLWGVRHLNGMATLVRIPAPYDRWEQVYTWRYGTVMYDLDVSPDGRLLSASVGNAAGKHSLRVMEIERVLEGDMTPLHEYEFGSTIPSGFVFSPDGRFLYGSSYYTGVSNIFRYELATRELEGLTNSETGFFRPIPLGDDRLYVLRFTGGGFVPAEIEKAEPIEDVNAITFLGQLTVEQHPELETWNVGPPSEIDLDARIEREGPFKPYRGIRLESVYPVIEGYKDFGAIGARMNFSDSVFLNRFDLSVSYTPDNDLPSDERLHVEANYKRYDWRAYARWNRAEFYDLFGPTLVSRKGLGLGLGYNFTLVDDYPRKMVLDLSATHAANGDQLPNAQNVLVDFQDLTTANVYWEFATKRASIAAVDYEKGIATGLNATGTYVDGRTIPSIYGWLDFGFPIPLKNSSVWFRNTAGRADGAVDDEFANFFFGGFGNNYLDHREVKRYRDYYAFPGLALNNGFGRTFAKSMFEWNLPPVRFRDAGSPGFYATYARFSLFATALVTNPDLTELREEYGNAGFQMDVRLFVQSDLQMTFSVGAARAKQQGGTARDEFMVSLKLLR